MNKYKLFLSLIVILVVYGVWWLLQPVEIIGVHHRSSGYNDVLVKHFPITDRGKIDWWEKNKSMLKNKYGIPVTDKDGNFDVSIWDIGDGYKEMPNTDQNSDLLCFDGMKVKANCIEKNRVLEVSRFDGGKISFVMRHSAYLQRKEGGEINPYQW
ncbi:DUF943 family protein [Xenorhabdus bovienii]|uniref:DUF943 family protein n=1 Tax=Xenorhabdus bovienii TaxID=40576 RepID=UPI0023B2D06C|nr:DUF943 family protein [Xenorhabdus bovienii]MDE9518522.1 DUF943 family protein [Xenorhabdus bovienii]MDE9527628.1 DUF943 family protein [Xenorhabdus bovienii]MDE9535899.1 DUF943 family protein [Xenorhabdus bovienii]MDE9570849.1 DUF943 family protein [Xenorhabdus bovienii]MDE9589356.1 DUF943 family protein [Xenorhabdus bovienii]